MKFLIFLVLVICSLVFYYKDQIPDYNKSGGFDVEDVIHAFFKELEEKTEAVEEVIKKEVQQPKQEPKKVEVPKAPSMGAVLKTGTGWFVNENHLVTNHHVIDGCNPNRIYVQNNYINTRATFLRSMLSGYNRTEIYDVYVLKTAKKSQYQVPLQEFYRVKAKEKLKVTGYPRGQYSFFDVQVKASQGKAHVISGDVNEKVYEDGRMVYKNVRRHDVIMLEGISDFGASGSPIVNKYGNLVAVLFAGKKEKAAIFATSALNLRKVLNNHKVKYEISRSKKTISRDKMKEDMEKYTVKVICYR